MSKKKQQKHEIESMLKNEALCIDVFANAIILIAKDVVKQADNNPRDRNDLQLEVRE